MTSSAPEPVLGLDAHVADGGNAHATSAKQPRPRSVSSRALAWSLSSLFLLLVVFVIGTTHVLDGPYAAAFGKVSIIALRISETLCFGAMLAGFVLGFATRHTAKGKAALLIAALPALIAVMQIAGFIVQERAKHG